MPRLPASIATAVEKVHDDFQTPSVAQAEHGGGFKMLRSAIISVFAIALGTMIGSGSAHPDTITTFAFVEFDLLDPICGVDCSAQFNPTGPFVSAVASANPGMNVNASDTEDFSLQIITGSSFGEADVRALYDFSMTFSGPLLVSGSYYYRLSGGGIFDSNMCSYPPRGFLGPGPSGCSFIDFNDFLFGEPPDTDTTIDFTAYVDAQAAFAPEPSSVGTLASGLVIFGWLHRRRKRERRPRYRCSVPVTTISTSRPPHRERTSRCLQPTTHYQTR